MRLSEVLFRHNYYRAIKAIWKRQGKMQFKPLEIPPELQEMGINIHDAREIAQQTYICHDLTPAADDDVLDVLALDKPKKTYYLFDNAVQVIEKEPQILALTKSLSFTGFPESLQSLVTLEKLPNQDILVKNCIVQSIAKDGQITKLPRTDEEKYPMTYPSRTLPRRFGVLYERKASLLIEKLAFLAQMISGKYPKSHTRGKILDPFSEVVIDKAGDTVVYQLLCDSLITSDELLKPFANVEEVENTRHQELLSIYPIKPTVDLWQLESNPMQPVKQSPFNVADKHIHTLHFVHKAFELWTPFQKLAQAVASCFAFSAQDAFRLYGKNVKDLPKPICVQCTHSDVQNIGFLAYQLNTLDFSNDNGIKNQVWIDGPHPLYEQVTDLDEIQNYNEEIFPKIIAMYLNGAHPHSV